MGIDVSIGAFLIERKFYNLGYPTWLTSSNDLQKELEIRKIMSDITKQNEVNALISEKGIQLKEETKEFLAKYFYRQGTKIRSYGSDIIIHTEDGAYSDEVCIKKDGSYSYCGGYHCVW